MPILRAVQIAACMVLLALHVFAPLLAAHRSRYRRLVQASLSLILVSGALWFVFALAEMSGGTLWEAVQPDMLARSLETQFGQLWAARMAGALLLLAGPLALRARSRSRRRPACSARSPGPATRRPARRARRRCISAPISSTSCSAASGPPAWSRFHLWLRDLREDERTLAAAAPLARGFSRLSTFIVAGLLLSGAVNMWLMLGGIIPLYTTAYGRLLLLKLNLLNVMLVLGAQNLRRWIPALADPLGEIRARSKCSAAMSSPSSASPPRSCSWSAA